MGAVFALIFGVAGFLLAAAAGPAGASDTARDNGEDPSGVWDHFGAHEPFYFLLGTNPRNAKIQFSLRYRILDRDTALPGELAWLKKLHIAYTQTSFWDLANESVPFTDNTFNPELIYMTGLTTGGRGLGRPEIRLQTGIAHESNGKAGVDSRSLNTLYAAPTVQWGEDTEFQVALTPRLWAYFGSLSDNPDIARFRGHASLTARLGWSDGLQAKARGRIGDDWDKGSVQIDLSYPAGRILGGGLGFFLHGQLFTGYGENLLRYNQKTTRLRIGISLVR